MKLGGKIRCSILGVCILGWKGQKLKEQICRDGISPHLVGERHCVPEDGEVFLADCDRLFY